MKRAILAITIAIFVGFTVSCSTTDDPSELMRTWDAAHVYLPTDSLDIPGALERVGPGGSTVYWLTMKPAQEKGHFHRIPTSKKYPVIIYMHGCIGISDHNASSGAFLAGELGVAVIQPASFARKYRPRNCNSSMKTSGMFRRAIHFRVAEANYAIREARKLSWVDPRNVFLMGHSEGGIATAKFTGEPINARIIEGATCHSGWDDWDGLDAPESEPVLSLLGANDLWQRNKPWSGMDCGPRMSRSNGSKSIVVTEGGYESSHGVLMDLDVQRAVKEFIEAHMRN